MKLTAINAKTGKVIMSQDGNLTEAQFRQTVASSLPNISQAEIIIINDGQITGNRLISAAEYMPVASNHRSVIWKGSFYDLGGYANMNREISLRLLQRGFSVKLDVLKTAQQADAVTIGMINALAAVKLPNEQSCPLVVGFTPMPIHTRGRRTIFYTMMETQGVHNEFADRCNKYATEVWVPCKYYFDAFKEANIVKPIYLLPLGVNDKIYHSDAKEPMLRYEEMPTGKLTDRLPNKFRFMSVFGWSYRKGADVLCRSFLREFSSFDDACLVIYSRYMGGSGEPQKEYIRNEIRGYYKEIGKENPPPIYYCGDAIPISDLPGCYNAADCFVFCSRGEGFGLPVVEAGACGIPVISTYNSAMTQYLDEDVSYLVQTDELAAANEKLTWITEFYRDQLFPVLGEPAIADFSRLMRHVYGGPSDVAEKATKFKDRILKEYTWDVCADRITKRLLSI